jgi:hypothetical protein
MALNRHDVPGGDDRTLHAPGINAVPETDPGHLIPDHTHVAAPGTIGAAAVPDDPDAVRGEIERTRARMSQTIDQLEGVLLRKKEEISDKLDVTAPVRQNPWAFAGGVFGAGLLLGFATGGGKDRADDDGEYVKIPRALLEGMGLEEAGGGSSVKNGRGAGDWETRSRELMQVVARQEDEIQDLRAALYGGDAGDGGLLPDEMLDGVETTGELEMNPVDEWDEDWNFDDDGDDFEDMAALGLEEEGGGFSVATPVAAAIAAGVAALVGGAATKFLRGRSGGEMDVEVELEPRHGAATDVRVDEGYRAARRDALGETPAAPIRGFDSDVTVERSYEQPRAGAYTGAGYAQPRSTAGYEGRREMEVEVELERPLPRFYDHEYYARHRGRSLPVSPLAAGIAAGAAALMGGLAAKLLHGRAERRGEMDVEVELEQGSTYRPSAAAQPRPASRAPQPRTQPAQRTGEMQVEVELEGRGGTQGRYPSSLDQRPASGSTRGTSAGAGSTRQASGATGEREYEVELEGGNRPDRDDSDPWGGGTGSQAPLM